MMIGSRDNQRKSCKTSTFSIANKKIQSIFILLAILFSNISLYAQESISQENSPSDTITGYSPIERDLSSVKETAKPYSSVKMDLTNFKATNELSVYEFLQGRVSGLDISTAASDHSNGNIQAVLRGQNFSGNQSPLIVIDGIPYRSTDDLSISPNGYYEDIQSLIPVALEDIQTIEILKDAATTLLYGAQGANGVILIETKKGKKQKLSLSYQFNQSFVNAPSYIPMLKGEEYVSYQLESWYNTDRNSPIPQEIAYDRDFPDYYNYSANTDWMKAVTREGNMANHHLSFSGGNEKNRLYGSVNYKDTKGTILNTESNRLLNRLNYEHYFSKKLTLAVNLSYEYGKADGNGMDILGMAFRKAPNESIWEYDPEGNLTGDYFTPYNTYQGSMPNNLNPVAISETSNASKTSKDLRTTAHLQYKFTDWLQLRETFTYHNLSAIAKANNRFPYPVIDEGDDQISINALSDVNYEQFRNEIQAFVKVPFKNEQINSLKSTLTWIRQDENYSKDSETLMDNRLSRTSGLDYERNMNALVSSTTYTLLNRYILMANARMQSNFKDDKSEDWDKFYGASLAWRFSEEPFFKSLQLNNGLIHAGVSDSKYYSDGGFSSFSFYSANNNSYDPFNNTYNPSIINSGNSRLQTQSYDAGIELELFKNRLHITSDYYRTNADYLSNPPTSTALMQIKNNGWEGAVDYAIIKKKNLSWIVQFNIAHNEQILDKINYNGGLLPHENGYFASLAEGKPLGSIFGFQREGVYSSEEDAYARGRDGNVYYVNGEPLRMMYRHSYIYRGGDTKYKDLNYDGQITDTDVVYLGNTNPDYTGGFGSTVRFRNLSLTCNFHYRTGHKVINQTTMDAEGMYGRNNMSTTVLNRWRRQGDQFTGIMPRAFQGSNANNLASDRYIESGSFARLNYLNLGYEFGQAFCQKIHVKDLALNLSGQRLYTYSNYSGLNPETEMNRNFLYGLNKDNSKVSPPEVYTISLRITI